jgi:hypothetical protein
MQNDWGEIFLQLLQQRLRKTSTVWENEMKATLRGLDLQEENLRNF